MIIKYVWWAEPDVEKIYDVHAAYLCRPYLNLDLQIDFAVLRMTESEFESKMVEEFQNKFIKGKILNYEIILT